MVRFYANDTSTHPSPHTAKDREKGLSGTPESIRTCAQPTHWTGKGEGGSSSEWLPLPLDRYSGFYFSEEEQTIVDFTSLHSWEKERRHLPPNYLLGVGWEVGFNQAQNFPYSSFRFECLTWMKVENSFVLRVKPFVVSDIWNWEESVFHKLKLGFGNVKLLNKCEKII